MVRVTVEGAGGAFGAAGAYAVPAPSTEIVTLPVGIVVPVWGATVMVKVTCAPMAGDAFEAATVVVVPINRLVDAGNTVASWSRSTEPRPVAKS